MLILFDL